MSLRDELYLKVSEYAEANWAEIPKGRVIPEPESSSLTHGNTGVHLDVTVLYADIDGSTSMVDMLPDTRAAEYYKAYLECAAKILKSNDGVITAYDGDRVMAIFIGDLQVESAVRSALQINWAVQKIINPIFSEQYSQGHLYLNHTIGIDKSTILAAKVGVRVDNDVVWVGPAANYAAKLNSFDGLDSRYPIRMTEQAMISISLTTFFRVANGLSIWEGPYTNLKRGRHYRTDCVMELD